MSTYENAVLNEREKTHGDFKDTANIAQRLKWVLRENPRLHGKLSQIQAESLDLICTKMARIVSGDPDCKDSWDDIAGYANLSGERLK